MARKCPNCSKVLPIGIGIEFDQANNVICLNCKKPIIASDSESEKKISSIKDTSTSSVRNIYGQNFYGQSPHSLGDENLYV